MAELSRYPQRVDGIHQFWDPDAAEACAREIARLEQREVIIETHIGDFRMAPGGAEDAEFIQGSEPDPHPILGRVRPSLPKNPKVSIM